MKAFAVFPALAAVVALMACADPQQEGQYSQRPQDEQRGRPEGAPPPDPILGLFDTDRDGVVSSDEINKAASVLKQFDRNNDGKLTRDELPRPPRPGDERQGERRPPQDGERNGERRPPRDGERNGERGPMREGERRPRRPEGDMSALPTGTVILLGGYETDRRDGGRPVGLIAAALGVEPQVFRDAFSGVTPARGRGPTDAEARANKDVLMAALGKHGITNDRLDEVSNYYRYRPQTGELWTHRAAAATAVIEDGKVVRIDITDAGAGYLSTPQVEVIGYPGVRAEASVEFGTDLSTNGRISGIKVVN